MTNTPLVARLIIVLLGLTFMGCARSPRPETAAEAASPATDETVTLLYDVRDLLVPRAPDFAVEYDEHGWPHADQSPRTPPQRFHLVMALKDAIMEIDPISWSDRHNGPGAVDEDAGILIVTQTQKNHEKIRQVIEHVRLARTTQITVQAYVIRDGDAWDQAERIAGSAVELGDATRMIYLDAEQIRALVEDRRADPAGAGVLAAPRVTLFNGQRAYVIIANETAYVADFEPADAATGRGGPRAVTKTVNSGVAIDCQAQASSDRRYVTLTVRPRLSTLRDMKTVPWADAGDRRNDLRVQVPQLTTAGVDATVSVPNSGWVLLRTVPQHDPPDADAPPPEAVVFAFGPTIHDVVARE